VIASLLVIARSEATKQSIVRVAHILACFASLAMTVARGGFFPSAAAIADISGFMKKASLAG
jgi:hypothetical protein